MKIFHFFFLISMLMSVQSAINPCKKYTKKSKANSVLQYSVVYCGNGGIFKRSACCGGGGGGGGGGGVFQRRSAVQSCMKSSIGYYKTYYTEAMCCTGYSCSGSQCLPFCNPSCGTNKECSAPDNCTCVAGWKGDDCMTPICSTACGTNIECSSPNTCTCVEGWKGSDCLTSICSPICGANMECSLPNSCSCVDGWKGNDCMDDIDECLEGVHNCEDGCKNTDGSYSCFCEDEDEVLAKDAEKCLGAVKDIVGISGAHEIALTWLPPANHSDDGNLSEYNITCINNTVINQLVPFKTNTYTFTSLHPFTTYKCCIEPHWSINGVGPAKCIEETTLEDAPEDSPQDVNVITAGSISVLIQWLPPSVPNGIITHYNVYINYTNGTNITTVTVEGSYTLYLLEQLDVFQLVGASISAITVAGEGPASAYTFNRSGETEPDPVHHLEIDIITNSSANVSWHPPVSLQGIIVSYHIVIRNLTEAHSGFIMNEWILDSNERNYEIENLEPFIPYEVDVAAATKVGTGKIVQKSFFTIESVPLIAPLWSLVQRVSATEVQLKWNVLPLELSRGYITKYTIKYADSVNTCFITDDVMTTETAHNHLLLTGLNPKLEYCVSIAASTVKGTGIYSQWTLAQVYEKMNIYFFLNGISNCKQWSQNDALNKLESFSDTLITAIHNSCQCQFTNDYLYSTLFLPCFKELAVVEATTILMTDYSDEELLQLIEEWVDTSPTINMGGLELFIERVCDNRECSSVASSSVTITGHTNEPAVSNSTFPLLLTLMPLSIAITVIVAIITVAMIVVVVFKKKRSGDAAINSVELRQNSAYSTTVVPSKFPAYQNPCYEECTVLKNKGTINNKLAASACGSYDGDDVHVKPDSSKEQATHSGDYDVPCTKYTGFSGTAANKKLHAEDEGVEYTMIDRMNPQLLLHGETLYDEIAKK